MKPAPPFMGYHSQTVLRLSEITDTGLFENLATSVLRAARPDVYENLTQPGVNPQGKTIKSPVDAISFVPGAIPQHMVTAHHSICARSKLKEKWLNDASTATSTAPAGDLIKTIGIANEQRHTAPDLRVTLALTTNVEPPDDVTRKAQEVAEASEVKLDIWSGTRLANYLDNDPTGQWLRRKYLGIEQERLSVELFRELSRASVKAYPAIALANQWILREGTRNLLLGLTRPVAFLIGESGFGKTVACYQYLSEHIERGGCGLVLPHEVIASALTIDDAIDIALRQLHPALPPGSGADARSLCSADSPLIIVVEDINRSGQSSHLIQRLATWSSIGSVQDERKPTLHLICPIWPELTTALGDDARKRVERLGARLGSFKPEDARQALLKRAASEGAKMSALEAGAIAETLGYDPLLIGLHDLKSSIKADDVIGKFVGGSTERLAQGNGTYAAPEYGAALGLLASAMLERREVRPRWADVVQWFKEAPEELRTLRELAKHGEVLRVEGPNPDAGIAFRHDRVLKWLLVKAATRGLLGNGLNKSVASDPYFAEIVGAALANPSVSPSEIERARKANPLALFHALRSFGEPSAENHGTVLTEIAAWLSDKSTHTRAQQSLRHEALHALSQTQSSHVIGIVAHFQDTSWTGHLAALRNGDLQGGVALCFSLEPGSRALWRDHAIEHARTRFGTALIEELKELLRRPGLTEKEIVGGLRIAGHFGEPCLAGAIEECWTSDAARNERLREYLWAAAQCGGERTDGLLTPICDAWATLPDHGESEKLPSPRDDLAAYDVSWAFWRRLPAPALAYFIKRAAKEDLRWQITYMLRGVDHPDAVSHLAHYLAERARSAEASGGFVPFLSTLSDRWRRSQEEHRLPMSKASRTRLEEIWSDVTNDKHLRKQSFRLWAATCHPDDLSLLQRRDSNDLLVDEVLRARLERRDQSAIPRFIEKLRVEDTVYWWQFGRKIWSPALTDVLDKKLSKRATAVSRSWEHHSDSDWMTSELVLRLERPVAEELLCRHWDHVRFSPRFAQAALYVATPNLLERVKEVMDECPDPRKMFKHIDSTFGIKRFGHPGVTHIEQVQAVIPYVDYLDPIVVHHFWELCSERGWKELRRKYLDSRLSGKWRELGGLDDETLFNELDGELGHDRTPIMDFWVERHLSSGRSIENVLSIVRRWLETNRTPRALEVAASAVIHAGRRKDVEILNAGDDGSELASEILADTLFAVNRRTLS